MGECGEYNLISSALANEHRCTFMNHGLVVEEGATEDQPRALFDPIRPGFIRRDEEGEEDEFEVDIGLSRAGAKRKNVRPAVRCFIGALLTV